MRCRTISWPLFWKKRPRSAVLPSATTARRRPRCRRIAPSSFFCCSTAWVQRSTAAWRPAPPWTAKNTGPCRVCLFNLNPFSGLEAQLLSKGIRGYFYRDAPLQHLAKGIQAVFNGELWVSRKAMIELLTRRGRDLPQSPPNTLSTREADILAQVVEGATNRTIAAALGLSPHTVKTHLYNIFKKINVRSRHQAALWAHRHL
jgi:DNA-binding CsgD family transcriptional regulator